MFLADLFCAWVSFNCLWFSFFIFLAVIGSAHVTMRTASKAIESFIDSGQDSATLLFGRILTGWAEIAEITISFGLLSWRNGHAWAAVKRGGRGGGQWKKTNICSDSMVALLLLHARPKSSMNNTFSVQCHYSVRKMCCTFYRHFGTIEPARTQQCPLECNLLRLRLIFMLLSMPKITLQLQTYVASFIFRRDMLPVIPVSSTLDGNFSRLFSHSNYPHGSYVNEDVFTA